MENLVPLGTGNSRLMKSNIPANTTLAQLIQMWNNGTFPYDIGPLNSAGISQQGTPLNKATLLKDATAALYGYSDPGPIVPDHLFATLSNAALYYSTATPKYQEVTVDLSTAQEGDIVQLEENGKLADFYVAKLNYESELNGAGRTLLVRKDCYNEHQWNSSKVNTWATCTILSWLNSSYKSLLGDDIQAAMGTTYYYFTPGSGESVNTHGSSVFLLSATEFGEKISAVNVEGSALPIASILHETGYLNTIIYQWTRSIRGSQVITISENDYNWTTPTVEFGARPVFTLPSTFTATYYVDSEGNLHDQQEYEVARSTTDVQGNPITIGTQIATGSYVGTGTYGEDNPNSLTFEFEPKILVISSITGDAGIALISGSVGSTWTSRHNGLYLLVASTNGKTIKWYSSGDSAVQMNVSSRNYRYTALG